jgi:hypothetical protein
VKQLEPLFTTNVTTSGLAVKEGAVTREFASHRDTSGVSQATQTAVRRVSTQNNRAPTFWVGKQAGPGKPFKAYWDKVDAVGHYDYGSLTMAPRTKSLPTAGGLSWVGSETVAETADKRTPPEVGYN